MEWGSNKHSKTSKRYSKSQKTPATQNLGRKGLTDAGSRFVSYPRVAGLKRVSRARTHTRAFS